MSTNNDINKLETPSVLSKDPNQRKLARRIRIQKRSEAQKKHETTKDDAIVDKTETEKQIVVSEDLLQKMIDEGNEIISNVRVANDAREVNRREEEIAIRKTLLEHLENEAQDSLLKYEEINFKWETILSSKDPLDLHAGIDEQTTKCNDILAQKDIIIAELKQELENADLKFENDQKKQNDDINLLIERIETQITMVSQAYRRELVLIENALKTERTALLQGITTKWDSLYEERQNNEMEGVERRRQIMQEYEKEMERLLIDHQEQYREQKIHLENECQKLQQEVQNMQATCMMNVEKLHYSYAILKQRENENTIIKNQQKKRINKLHDIINDLKKTYADLEDSMRLKIEKLQEQVVKAHKNIQELESKSNHFSAVNDKRFMQIWEMNTNTADKLLEQILTADKIIYEQMLGLDWQPPKESILKKEDLPSYRQAMRIIDEKNAEREKIMKLCSPEKRQVSPARKLLEQQLLSQIMTQIADQTGFLVEEKMRELLSMHEKKDQIVIRLDNIFHALGIQSEDQVNLLINFFLPYTYCPRCDEEEEEKEKKATQEAHLKALETKHICLCKEDLNERDLRLLREVIKHLPEPQESEKINPPLEAVTTTPEEEKLTCAKGHLLAIRSENVIRALREFVEKYHDAKCAEMTWGDGGKLSDNRVTISRSISVKDMTEYWRRYRDIFSRDKEKLWDALVIGLHKYHEILKERQKLMIENDNLRQQNDELCRLLETHKGKSGNCCIANTGSKSANQVF